MHPNLQTLCLNVYQYHFSKFYQFLITLYKIKNPFSVGRVDCYDALSYHPTNDGQCLLRDAKIRCYMT